MKEGLFQHFHSFLLDFLRYGLPVNFQAMLLQPNKKTMKKLREVLYDLYKHLDSSAAAIIDVSTFWLLLVYLNKAKSLLASFKSCTFPYSSFSDSTENFVSLKKSCFCFTLLQGKWYLKLQPIYLKSCLV